MFLIHFVICLFGGRLVGKLVSPLPAAVRRAKKHLVPIIQERLANEERYGEDWEQRPVRSDSLVLVDICLIVYCN